MSLPPSGHTKLGGYQVFKKWLSYRERSILGRPLKPKKSSTLPIRRGGSERFLP